MPSFKDLIAIKEQVESEYLGWPGVTGIDVGYKEVGGRQTDQIAIRVHVSEKKTEISDAQRVPSEIDGVITDVLERNYQLQVVKEAAVLSPQADTTHYGTLDGGISMGPSRSVNGFIYAGTLGAIVIDNTNNAHAALTNFHVACVDSTWNVGDRMVQPSRIDTGVVPGDEFGAIVRAVLSENVDGAVISIDAGKQPAATITDIGAVKGTKVATLGMAVRKRGRTTGLTYGTVDGLAASVNVDYGDGIGVKLLKNQISIASDTTHNAMFSDHGDSGSVIVDDQGYVVALLFAGAGAGTVGNPIAAVLSELNVSIYTGPVKSIIKDIKDGRKDFIKDKEIRKEFVKEKEIRKDIQKEFLIDNKRLKDFRDVMGPIGGGDQPDPPFSFAVGQRLAGIEAQLAALTSFITAEQRPDLSQSAFSGQDEPNAGEVEQLRSELEQQVADLAAAKAGFDTPQA